MSSSGGTPLAAHKHIRVLACVLCQHRKIKCDRNTPCSNCVKANVTCTPSVPAPARKRRRPNQDLQERLARCEKLLQQYAAGGSPPDPMALASPDTTTTKSESTDRTMGVGSENSLAWKKAGRMIQEEGGARFMDSEIWATLSEELQGMRTLMDEESEDASIRSPDESTPENQSDLLLAGDVSRISIDDLIPDAVHVFRLWQIFLDRVNPLTKLIHVPTIQPYVVEITSNPSNVPLNYQALLFAIMGMATVSLTQSESIQLLGLTRERAIQNFNSATRTALVRQNFLKNFSMPSLQALILFIHSIESRYNRHSAWVLSGIIVRIAIKMGYHRDGEELKLNPFETEMRRRIWWGLMMYDGKLAQLSGLTNAFITMQWDTKQPLNINDSDLFPSATEPVKARDGPTEMIWYLMIIECFKFGQKIDASESGHAFEAAVLGQGMEGDHWKETHASVLQNARTYLDELINNLIDVESKYCDPSAGNVHIAALTIRPRVANHLTALLTPIHEQEEWGSEIFGPKDVMFKFILMANENRANAFDQMTKSGFLWYVRLHFQDELFAILTAQLTTRTKGSLVERAWKVIERTYRDYVELFDMTEKAYLTQAQLSLRAWGVRERVYREEGFPLDTPSYIVRLRDMVPTPEPTPAAMPVSEPAQSKAATPSNIPYTQALQYPQTGIMNMNAYTGGYLDTSSMNWDMLGDMMVNENDQFSSTIFAPYNGGTNDGHNPHLNLM